MLTNLARKYTQFFIDPIARFIGWTGISPNLLTVVGFLLTVGVAIVIAMGNLQWGGVLIVLAAGFDGVDGTLARTMGRTSKFGAFLDSTLDRFSEGIIYLGLFLFLLGNGAQIELVLVYVTVLGSLLVSYTRARAEGIDVSIKQGVLTRFERIGLLVIGLVFNQLLPVLWILAVLTNFTALQRIWLVWKITGGELGG